MRLTSDQRMVLRHVRDRPSMTTDEAAENFVGGHGKWSYDRAYASLKRLAARGLVERTDGTPTRWSITTTGESALDA